MTRQTAGHALLADGHLVWVYRATDGHSVQFWQIEGGCECGELPGVERFAFVGTNQCPELPILPARITVADWHRKHLAEIEEGNQ